MRRALFILSMMAVVLGVAVCIFWILRISKPDRHVPFYRKNKRVWQVQAVKLDREGYYYAGSTNTTLYLGNKYLPLMTKSYSLKLQFLDSIQFLDSPDHIIGWKALTTIIDSPDVYFFERLTPSILSSNVFQNQIIFTRPIDINFMRIVPIGVKKYVLRVFDDEQKVSQFIKYDLTTGDTQRFPTILEKQRDGLFCTDGTLTGNSKCGLLAYTYFYRNEFFIFDTSGTVKIKARTIDTVSTVNFDTVNLKNGSELQIGAPPLIVNRSSFIRDGKLFILATAITTDNNQTSEDPIDVYSVKTGEYMYTYYIPKFRGRRPASFFIENGYLFAFYSRYLVTYQL
jgi:hypothetical protein